MKLAIVGSRGIPGHYGAFEIFSEKLASGLIELGYDVTVICPHFQNYQEPKYKNINLEYIYHPKGAVGTFIYDGLALWKTSKKNYDIILMLGYASSPLCIIPRIFRRKIIINTDGLEWRRSKWPWYGKIWLRFAERTAVWVASRLVSDSKAIASYYKDKYGVGSVFIPYGTEIFPNLGISALEEYGLKPDDYYLVVMRMEPENSIKEIVEGFLKAKTIKPLILIGPSTPFFESNVRSLLNEKGGKVYYIGAIYDREKLFQIRQNAFAYIHGHTVGGTNPSLLEAMVSKNIIIAKDVNFNREVLEDVGYYFNSSEELSAVIEALEHVPMSLLSQKKEAAKELILNHYTWESVINDYDKLFKSFSDGKRDN